MMASNPSATESQIASRNRVTDALRRELHIAVHVERRLSVPQISEGSGVPVRAIRSYMASDPGELREPSVSAALSIACVMGRRTVNALLAEIGYGGATPLEEPDEMQPMQIVANAFDHFNVIVRAASDNRIDHTEEWATTEAADMLIATVLPLSSAGKAE